ncbi:MAG TPA: hypothetical protein VF006_27860 [Longimicrobium sp.]
MRTRGHLALLSALLLAPLALAACGAGLPRGMVFGTGCKAGPCPSTDSLEEPGLLTRLILIGDAGDPWPGTELSGPAPVLEALERWAWRRPELTTVVFLGDNIYPEGLRPGVVADSLRLARQIQVFAPRGGTTRPRAVFVPGNHDWYGSQNPATALAAIRREAEMVRAAGERMHFLPAGGCPGPDTLHLGNVRLIALDTQWWLYTALPPELRVLEDECTRPTAGDPIIPTQIFPFLAELGWHLFLAHDVDSVDAVVVSHHPLTAHGPHAQRKISERIREGIHALGISNSRDRQDLAAWTYRQMIEAIAANLRFPDRPFIYAAGHEHVLEVIDGRDSIPYGGTASNDTVPIADYHLVSGNGSSRGHLSPILPRSPVPLFWSAGAQYRGFMVVDFLDDAHGRRVFLRVIHAADPDRPAYHQQLR